MRTVVAINGANVGSTGRIMRGVSELAESKGFKVYQAYPKSRNMLPARENDIIISSVPVKYLSTRAARLTGLNGCFAWFSTMKFLRKLDKIKPDILHFHNLHDSYINLPMLFNYVKRRHIKVIWTLHDCWSFTGHCPHFTYIGCEKWKRGCGDCPQLQVYPSTNIDTSKWMWRKKKKWFTGVGELTIVTPSDWLASLVKESFLSSYPVKVINNGIDLDVFRPIETAFRESNNVKSLYLILGVSFSWGKKKGLDAFFQLAEKLNDDYRIVLVGTNESLDEQLPKNIISIHNTNDQIELAKIYAAADVLVNPTLEDTFPTVNIEALACGTPVITFAAGGSPEIIDSTCGSVVPIDDIDALVAEIKRVCEKKPFSKESCVRRASLYNRDSKFEEYLELYMR